jgi:hypothetical protein
VPIKDFTNNSAEGTFWYSKIFDGDKPPQSARTLIQFDIRRSSRKGINVNTYKGVVTLM